MHPVMKIFEEIAAIPHGSRNEQAISDYLFRYASERGYQAWQDDALNVIVKLPATPGREHAPGVILQGHMDMVCEKTPDSTHDFTRDPLRLVYEGDLLRAQGTTLGADDGIALAYGLALLDSAAPHPPVELLFTVDEESSMKGVKSFDPALFQGRMLINLDSAGEGKITVSAAGGIVVNYHIPIQWEPSKSPLFRLTVSGLLGGHSGGEIDKERGNAIKLLCRVLEAMSLPAGLGVASVTGGTKTNAIPLEAGALVTIAHPEQAAALAAKWSAILREEYRASDPGVTVTLESAQGEAEQVFSRETAEKLFYAAGLTLCGPDRWDRSLGIVMNSNSMGVLRTEEGEILLKNNLRSSGDALLEKLVWEMRTLARLLEIGCTTESRYPGWPYRQESPLRDAAVKAYHNLRGKDPELIAIHAGLEIGYLAEKLEGLDAISFGPDAWGGHTVSERLSVSSMISTYEYLEKILGLIGVTEA